jgi:hypothetical protein
MIYLYTKLHMRSSNGASVSAVKLKLKENVRTNAMLFYILQRNAFTKAAYFLIIH